MRPGPKPRPASDRFWSKVAQSLDGCWIWNGATAGKGYGIFWVIRDGVGAMTYAHRWAYEQAIGPIPAGLQIDHLCREPRCVRPDHLEPVTNRENTLRGDHPNAVTWRTDRCRRGHSMHNAYRRPDGGRECRACKREAGRRYELRRAASHQPALESSDG